MYYIISIFKTVHNNYSTSDASSVSMCEHLVLTESETFI